MESQANSAIGALFSLIFWGWVIYMVATHKKRKAKKEEARKQSLLAIENRSVDVTERFRIIEARFEALGKAKSVESARNAYERLEDDWNELISCYPHRNDWIAQWSFIRGDAQEKLQSNLDTIIARYIEKARLAKTVSTKVANYNKALFEISEAENFDGYDEQWLENKRDEIEKLIHASEFGKMVESAELYEFKGETKKALSAYQDALFYLKKDSIDDAEQEELIANIEGKVQKLQILLAR